MANPWDVVSTTPLSPQPGAVPPPDQWSAQGAPASMPQAPQQQENPGRIAGQVGVGANDALYSAIMALPDFSAWISRKIGLVPQNTPPPSQAFQDFARSQGNQRPDSFAPQTTGERIANDIGTAGGQVAGSLAPLGVLSRTGALGPLATGVVDTLKANPIQQTAYTAAGNVVGDLTADPRLGAATTLVAPLLTHGAQRAVSAAPAATTQEAERRALLDFGSSIGAPQTAGKILGSKTLQTGESVVNKLPLPFVGGRTTATEAANRNAYQGKAIEKAGTYGETAATPDVLSKVATNVGSKFDALENSTTVNIDHQFGNDIANAKADFSKQLMDQMPAGIVKKLDELSSAATTAGQPGVTAVTLDGETYKNIRSKLSKQLSKSSGTDQDAIGAMIDALDGAMERSVPKDMAKDWQVARQQWRNYIALRKAVTANNEQTALGNFSTAAYGKASANNPDIKRLGQYGNAMVGDKIPDSGTGQRLGWTHLLGLGAGGFEGMQHAPGMTMAAAGAAAVPYAFDMALNNPVTRAALLARYRNPSEPFTTGGLMGSLIGQQALKQTR